MKTFHKYTCYFQIVAGASVFFICVSVLSFCLKTHPGMRLQCKVPTENLTNVTNCTGELDCENDTRLNDQTDCTEEPLPFFLIVEHICNAWFTFELLVRLIVSILLSFYFFFRGDLPLSCFYHKNQN